MKKIISRIILHSGIAVSMLLATYYIHTLLLFEFSLAYAFTLISIMALLQIVSELYFHKIYVLDNKSRMVKIMLIRGIKFLLYLVLSLISVLLYPQYQLFYGLYIVIIYFIYTAIELSFFTSQKQ